MENVKELTNLINLIEQWGVKLNLDVSSEPLKQNLKLFEEVGELATSIQKNSTLDIMDAIGDTVVISTIIGLQLRKFAVKEDYSKLCLLDEKSYLTDNLGFSKKDVSFLFYRLIQKLQVFVNYCVDAYGQTEHGIFLFKHYTVVLNELLQLSQALGLDLNECVKMAYCTIYFRTGEIVNGVFVKRNPSATIRISTEDLKLPIDNLINKIVQFSKENKIEFFKVSFDLPKTICD